MWTNIHFLTDGVMWIWHYDRQGCIQSEGINFLEDLPTFLVLLYALQRLYTIFYRIFKLLSTQARCL